MTFKKIVLAGLLILIAGCVSSRPFTQISGGQIKILKEDEGITKELVRLEIQKDVYQRFLLYTPSNPTHTLVLFTGGDGRLGLSDSGFITMNKENFTVRIIKEMLKAGFKVALVDAPENMQGKYGLFLKSYRVSENHFQDIRQILSYISSREELPVWLLGFSMGNHSSTFLAGLFKNEIEGLIIVSSATQWPSNYKAYSDYPRGILDIDLDQITVPTLIMHHKDDWCDSCPPSNVPLIEKALSNASLVKTKLISGGLTHKNPCGPLGHHGFRGRETEATETIVQFVKSN